VNGEGSSWHFAQGIPAGNAPATGIAQNSQQFPIHGKSVLQSTHTKRSSSLAMTPQKTQRRGINAALIEVIMCCISRVALAE